MTKDRRQEVKRRSYGGERQKDSRWNGFKV